MSEVLPGLFVLVLTVLGAWACEYVPRLTRRPWAVGLAFGLLAIVSDLCACRIGGWRVLVSCAMPLVAVLFFGSVAVHNFLSGNALALILFSIGFGLMSGFVVEYADRQTDAAVLDAQQRLEHDIDDITLLSFCVKGRVRPTDGH